MGLLGWFRNLFEPQPHNRNSSTQRSTQQWSPSHLPTHTTDNMYMKYDDTPPAPPAYSTVVPAGPSAGPSRITFQESPSFPSQSITGPAPCFDLDGSPVFFGSAHFPDSSIHPCKIAPALGPSSCRVPYGGGERHHAGPYTLLPFDPETMELVPTSGGKIPEGRRPVEGGHEKDKNVKLYHAVANVTMLGKVVKVPGKTAPHLFGCNFAWGGAERVFRANYEILCWKEGHGEATSIFVAEKKQ
ncbi:hypothetical protein BDP27DRAFT_1262045 [Rhodocollybia butyracea]|uniref:Uncharacterized protein n=1 Tax=Rhodocollybia butyracea TaxID=206335 RepID=A0A9P5PZ88_9AGAR|nr:hypothetical protein BDP27DRAFT_1262045 [Rhodocollybia butyracea]